jgi:ubiquinol-cytochrome c reductase cytochrome b/c1 subunit
LIIALIHLFFLHEFGSSNPTGLTSILDGIPFSPYYTLKDGFSIILLLFLVLLVVFNLPDMLGHTVNYEKANFLVTPAHIVPE